MTLMATSPVSLLRGVTGLYNISILLNNLTCSSNIFQEAWLGSKVDGSNCTSYGGNFQRQVCFPLDIYKLQIWFLVSANQLNKCYQRYVSLHVRKSNRAALNLYTQALRFQ